jgi:uncharacterized membrane protein
VKNTLLARWQANFWAGLATVLPAAVTFIVLFWLFKTVGNLTDPLLFFLPHTWTHGNHGQGELYWYCSILAVVIAVFLIGIVGLVARNYFGKRLIEWVDAGLLKVPLLNKIYAATKQVNDAFSPQNKTAFRTVVAIEYPKAGVYTIGFITNDQPQEAQEKLGEKLVCVFVPTTPNPTAGFLLFVPDEKVTKLDMSVADGIKYVISLGSIVPDYSTGSKKLPAAAEV